MLKILLFLLVILIILRILYLIYQIYSGKTKYEKYKRTKPAKTIICIGSGGHTKEILLIVNQLDFKLYSPRVYIMASSDTTSLDKIIDIEKDNNDYLLYRIPRSRYVNQSYLSSIFTTLYSILYSSYFVLKTNPDLVLSNGPGTCIPICLVAFLIRALLFQHNRIVFVESYCRVYTLSLTGKILLFLADNFVVQWEDLKKKVNRADYLGNLF